MAYQAIFVPLMAPHESTLHSNLMVSIPSSFPTPTVSVKSPVSILVMVPLILKFCVDKLLRGLSFGLRLVRINVQKGKALVGY